MMSVIQHSINYLLKWMDSPLTNQSSFLQPLILLTHWTQLLRDPVASIDRLISHCPQSMKGIYNVHLKKIKVNKEKSRDEYAAKMAALTPGFSGADIANVCNEGAIIAARNDVKSVGIR